jgi:hypothetical protein
MPSRELTLQTIDNEYYFFKADILAHRVTYSTDKHLLANEATISAKRAFEIIMMNREGRKPENIHEDGTQTEQKSLDLLEQENINRFDKTKKKKKRNKENGQRENAPVVAAEEKNVQNERRVKPNVERPKREEGRDRNKPEQKVVKKAEHKVEQKSEQKVEQKAEVQKKNDHQQQHQRRRKHRSQNSNNNKNNPTNGNNNQN